MLNPRMCRQQYGASATVEFPLAVDGASEYICSSSEDRTCYRRRFGGAGARGGAWAPVNRELSERAKK